MKIRNKITFITAALTVACIVLFQIYWIYYNYKNIERDFNATVAQALDKAILRYQSQQIELPTSLNYKTPSLTVFMRTKPNSEAFVLDTPKTTRHFDAEFRTVAIDKFNEPLVRALIIRLMNQQLHKAIDLESLTYLYRNELKKNGIDIPVTLVMRKKPAEILPGEIADRIDFYKSPVIISANLEKSSWLLQHNILPATGSVLLILLSIGSLYYTALILQRQLKLDQIKDDFINNISHELRTPLSILRSSNEAIAHFKVGSDPQKLSRYTEINAAIINKLENELERILDVRLMSSLADDENSQSMDLYTLLERVIDRFEVHSASRIKLSGPNPFNIKSDPFKIDSIFSNLLDNAIKYSANHTPINVKISISQNTWQLNVSDKGIGISEENLPWIFDKFFRVNTGDLHDVKGYGLGLTYVKNLVESLKGTIDVKSILGHGTTFILTFPV